MRQPLSTLKARSAMLSRTIPIVLIICLFFAIAPMVIVILRSPEQAPVEAERGVVHLENELRSDRNRVYSLGGQWEYYPDRLYTYNDFLHGVDEPEFVTFPHVWTVGGRAAKGYGTYRVRVKVPQGMESLSVLSLNQYSSQRVYLNDLLVSEAGRLDPSFKRFVMGFYNLTGYITLPFRAGEAPECDVIVQVQNEVHASPGLRGKVFFSGRKQINSLKSATECVDNFVAGCMLVIIFYFCVVFLSNRKRTEYADYALASFIALWVALLNTGGAMAPYRFIIDGPAGIDRILLRLAYYFPSLGVFFAMRHVLERNFSRRTRNIVYIFAAVVPSIHLWLPIPVSTSLYAVNGVLTTLVSVTPGIIDIVFFIKKIGKPGKKLKPDSILSDLAHLLLFTIPVSFLFRIGFWYGIYGFTWTITAHMLLQIIIFSRYYQRLEDDVIDLNRSLETKVDERTRELQAMTEAADAARNLAEDAQRMAEEASRYKSDFLAKMSHEIRTPLNAIIGMSDLINSDNFDETQKQYLHDMERMSHTLLGIVNDILDFSKIEAGKLELSPVHYNIRRVFDDIASMQGFLAKEKGLEFRAEFSPEVPEVVYGDEVRMRQIFSNLTSNAVKYTSRGFVEFNLKKKELNGAAFIAVEVRDSGVGIHEEEQDRLFTSFEQLDRTKNRQVQGTGLGLAITKQILDIMGGSITVESVYGEGASFTAYIPLVKGDPSQIENALGENAQVQAITGDIKVLVVDDFRINLSVALGYLEKHGIKADTAESGEEALQKVREQPYDLIFMDHMMPGMDGVETAQAIRAMDEAWCRTVPIIAFTANAVQGTWRLFKEAGMNDFISKPVRGEELNRILGRWLPPEKIRISPRASTGQPAGPPADGLAAELADLGLDVERAAGFLGDADGVLESLRQFNSEYDRYTGSFREAWEKEDWKNFAIYAHGLKGIFALLSKDDLSEMAKKLEFAGKEGRIDEIRESAGPFLEALAAFREKMLAFLASHPESRPDAPPRQTVEPALLREKLEGLYNAVRGARSRELSRASEALDALALEGDIDKIWIEGWTKVKSLLYAFEYIKAAEEIRSLLDTLGGL